jgi:formylglycine-generating enzyme required for sulfatase activity
MKLGIMETFSFLIAVMLIFFPREKASAQETFTNTIGMEFIKIEPGTMTVGEFTPQYPVPDDTVKGADRPYVMWMGDGRPYSAEEFRLAKEMAMRDASKGFVVTLQKPYYLGKFEVTQGQWKKIMGTNPSTFTNDPDADTYPVEGVSWREAKKFVKRLNKIEKKRTYRLPSEFEWEFAARAGATGDIPWEQIQASANLSKTTTSTVGSKQPNAWGFYDMLGNVWEWVADYYNEKLFADPVPPSRGGHHVLKGASFTGDVKNATYMTHAAGPGNGWDIGFRVLLEFEDVKQ